MLNHSDVNKVMEKVEATFSKKKFLVDDYSEVLELMEKMEMTIPIAVQATNNFYHILRDVHQVKIKPKQVLQIKQVHYAGDEGGILCVLGSKGLEQAGKVFSVSLTHLRVKRTHPLYKEIHAYQLKRTRKIANRDRG